MELTLNRQPSRVGILIPVVSGLTTKSNCSPCSGSRRGRRDKEVERGGVHVVTCGRTALVNFGSGLGSGRHSNIKVTCFRYFFILNNI